MNSPGNFFEMGNGILGWDQRLTDQLHEPDRVTGEGLSVYAVMLDRRTEELFAREMEITLADGIVRVTFRAPRNHGMSAADAEVLSFTDPAVWQHYQSLLDLLRSQHDAA